MEISSPEIAPRASTKSAVLELQMHYAPADAFESSGPARRSEPSRPAPSGARSARVSAAAKTSASSVPGATVEPRASSTGTPEKQSSPKPMTVHRLARPNDARVSGEVPPGEVPPGEVPPGEVP